MTPVATVRVFLLDDHELVRRGLRELLESEEDMVVVGEAGTAAEAQARIAAATPDVAILDVRLPDGDGVDVCREIRSAHPDIACIMLTSFADDEAVYSAIMAGIAPTRPSVASLPAMTSSTPSTVPSARART